MAVFDVVLVVIVILCVLVGLRRGFVLTLCGLLSIIIALVGANAAANQFSPVVTQAIAPRIETAIEANLKESVNESTKDALDWEDAESDPGLSGILGALQQSEAYKNAVSAIQDSIQSGMESTLKTAAESMAQKVAQPVAWGTVYIIAFFVILLLWNLVSRALDLVAKLPILHFFNRLLGGAFGLLKGLLIVGCVCWLLLSLGLLPTGTVQQSAFLRVFSGLFTTSI